MIGGFSIDLASISKKNLTPFEKFFCEKIGMLYICPDIIININEIQKYDFSLWNNKNINKNYFILLSVDEVNYNIATNPKIKNCQRIVRRWRRNKAAKIIQKGCDHWLSKPITKDGKLGIKLRIGLKECCKIDLLYPTDELLKSLE